MSGINEGFLNEITVQAESSFAGSVTGTARRLVGQVSFQYEPQLIRGMGKVNAWGNMDGDSFAGRFYRGSMVIEYRHGETLALLLSSLLTRNGSSPNYTFSQSHRSVRQSLAIGLSYKPNNVHFVFRGLIITGALFTVRVRELIQVRLDFLAAKLTTDGPLTSPSTESVVGANGLQASLEYEGVGMSLVYDASFQIANPVEFVNYGVDKIPVKYIPSGRFTVSSDLGEWMSSDATAGDRIASDVRNQSESDAEVSIVPASGKLLQLTLPRLIGRSGTPPGLGRDGIGYRAGFEAQVSEARTDKPVLTLTL